MASNRRWRGQFRCRGSRRESAVAQLFSLGHFTPLLIFMNTKPDDDFVATAADPARRSTAIADLTKKHTRLSWISIIILLGFFGICFFASKPPDSPFILVVIIPFFQAYKCESDLRLLRVVERLQTYDRPVA